MEALNIKPISSCSINQIFRATSQTTTHQRKSQMKSQKFIVFAVAIAVIALSGCASVGNESLRKESEASVNKKIIEGKTSKNEVRAMFGSPNKTSFTDGGLEIWNYDFTNVSLDAISYVPIVSMFGGSSSGKKKELVVMFDKENLVKRYSMSEADVTQKTGLFNR